ncbi:MAG: hypothetical protein GX484_10360 [Chloroflexi bacterium]|nr:hypothetical protein [Chloroflexota bacterium]
MRVVRQVFEGRDPGDVRTLVSRLAESDRVVVLAGIPGEKAQLILARSADLPTNLNGPLQAAFAVLGGGRGGGRPDFCQGGGVPADAMQVAAALDAAEQAIFESAS